MFRIIIFTFVAGVSIPVLQAADPNVLTEAEKEQGFQLLFNGKNLEGWKNAGNWKVVDQTISHTGRGGHLIFDAQKIPDDFELRFEWKVAKASNSGIIYYRKTRFEYQILDNKKNGNGKNPRTSAASLYFCMPPSKDNTKPVGQWNRGRILCKGTVMQHWLNGEKVIDIDTADKRWAAQMKLLNRYRHSRNKPGGKLHLQDHGDPVWYRAVKFRTIPQNEKVIAGNFTPAKISESLLQKEQAKLKRLERIRKNKQSQQTN